MVERVKCISTSFRVPSRKKSRRQKSPLIGLFLHTYDNEGRLQYQARIIGVDDDVVVCRAYDFLTGYDTCIKLFSKSFILSDRCQLYDSHEAWHGAYERYDRRMAQMAWEERELLS